MTDGSARPTAGRGSARVATGVTGYVLAAAALGNRRLPVACPWRRLTGRPCPLCGTSRSVALAVRGRVRESLAMHALGLPLTAFAGWWLTRLASPPSPTTPDHLRDLDQPNLGQVRMLSTLPEVQLITGRSDGHGGRGIGPTAGYWARPKRPHRSGHRGRQRPRPDAEHP